MRHTIIATAGCAGHIPTRSSAALKSGAPSSPAARGMATHTT